MFFFVRQIAKYFEEYLEEAAVYALDSKAGSKTPTSLAKWKSCSETTKVRVHENFGGTTVPISLTIPSGTEKGYMTTLTVAKSRTLSISTFYLIRNLVVVNVVIQPYSVPIGIVREI